MRYGLYLRQSFRRRGSRHGILAVILVCVLVLPFMTCVMRDSWIYGQQQQELERTKDAAFCINYAKEEYLSAFSNLPGLRAWFEDGRTFSMGNFPRSGIEGKNGRWRGCMIVATTWERVESA